MKLSKIRYYLRCIDGWKTYLSIRLKAAFFRSLCHLCKWLTPVHFAVGFLDLSEAVSRERDFQEAKESWNKFERDRLFLGADSDNPDGIYAQNGSDMVCITNEEYEDWFAIKEIK